MQQPLVVAHDFEAIVMVLEHQIHVGGAGDRLNVPDVCVQPDGFDAVFPEVAHPNFDQLAAAPIFIEMQFGEGVCRVCNQTFEDMCLIVFNSNAIPMVLHIYRNTYGLYGIVGPVCQLPAHVSTRSFGFHC